MSARTTADKQPTVNLPIIVINSPTTYANSKTIDNATLQLGSGLTFDNSADIRQNGTGSNLPVTLRFGSQSQIVQTVATVSLVDSSGTLGPEAQQFFSQGSSFNSLLLEGNLTANVTGGKFAVSAGTVINSGTIYASNGDALTVGGDRLGFGSFTNTSSGTIVATGSGTHLTLGVSGHFDQGQFIQHLYQSFSNQGYISVLNGASLELQGIFDVRSLKGVTNTGGQILLNGALDLQNTTLGTGSNGTLGKVTLGTLGEISNGLIDNRNNTLTLQGGTLHNVTYRAAMLDVGGKPIYFEAGLNLVGADGKSPGILQGSPTFVGDQAFDNATVNLTGTLGIQSLQETYYPDNGGGGFAPTDVSVTFGSNVHIVQRAKNVSISGASGDAFNQSSNGDISFSYQFTNNGVIDATKAGGTLSITNFNDFNNAGRLNIGSAAAVTVNADFQSFSFFTFTKGQFTNKAGGTISIGSGASLTTGQTSDVNFTNAGMITLAGGTLDISGPSAFSSYGLNDTTGHIAGRGRIVTGIYNTTVNSGVIEATGGLLVIDGGLTGGGAATIDAGARLELTAAASAIQFDSTVSFQGANATLILDAAGGFTGTLNNWQASDRIDFRDFQVKSVAQNGTILAVIDTSNVEHDIKLGAVAPAGTHYTFQSDGKGGSFVNLVSNAQVQGFAQAIAAFGTSSSVLHNDLGGHQAILIVPSHAQLLSSPLRS